jgi:hypothetical protein
MQLTGSLLLEQGSMEIDLTTKTDDEVMFVHAVLLLSVYVAKTLGYSIHEAHFMVNINARQWGGVA